RSSAGVTSAAGVAAEPPGGLHLGKSGSVMIPADPHARSWPCLPPLAETPMTFFSRINLLACVLLALLAIVAGSQDKPAVQPALAVAGDKEMKIIVQEDVVYGRVQGAVLLADLAYPEGKGPFPVILSVHGGRWFRESKSTHSAIKVRQWAGFGFFAMS